MLIAVTRPKADGERTAQALRARGHDVLLAPLMRVEPVAADLSGEWSAVAVTSANALPALEKHPELQRLPIFTVGRRSAAAASGLADVHSAGGDVRHLVGLIVERHRGGKLLYLAGKDRSGDLVAALAKHGIEAEMRIVYRAVTAPYPEPLIAALEAGSIDVVLHFSRRSAENYVTGAHGADIAAVALKPRHLCLSVQVAEPLRAAGGARIEIAPHPDEVSLLGMIAPGP
jgi:uroporphyrinogen-III synthase